MESIKHVEFYMKSFQQEKYQKFDEDREEDWVNCDLPPYLHMEIVMRAVQIYLASIGATSNGADKQS